MTAPTESSTAGHPSRSDMRITQTGTAMQNDTAMSTNQIRSSQRGTVTAAIIALIVACLPAISAAQGTIMPTPQQVFLDASGNPINNGKICTYAAGTTTPLATYSDVTLMTANANPIRTNSAGRPTTGGVYLSAASYKFIVLTAGSDNTCNTGTTVYTQDNVGAVPTTAVGLDVTGTAGESLAAGEVVYLSDGSGALTAGRWYKADGDNTYSSSTAAMVGLVTSAVSSGASCTCIRVGGRITGLSGLAVGEYYYASGTAGALTGTPPTNQWLVGKADTTTSLLITQNQGGVRLPDSDGTHALVVQTSSNLTADRLLTLVPGDAARTLTLSGNATVDQDLSTTATPTFGAGIAFGSNATIRRTTSDASDNGSLEDCGGGATGSSRGSCVAVHGNEHATLPGYVSLNVGNVAGSRVRALNAAGTAMWAQLGADGSITQDASIAAASGFAYKLNNSNASPVGIDVQYTAAAPNGTGNLFGRMGDTGATRFEFRSNGGLANFQANDVNLSDARSKVIRGAAPSQRSLFRRLQFVEARYRDAPTTPDDVMLTAQNVQAVYPSLIAEFADGFLGVKEHGVVMRGLAVVQELDAAVVDHDTRLAAIEAKLRTLEAENAALRAQVQQLSAPR